MKTFKYPRIGLFDDVERTFRYYGESHGEDPDNVSLHLLGNLNDELSANNFLASWSVEPAQYLGLCMARDAINRLLQGAYERGVRDGNDALARNFKDLMRID